MGEGEEDTKPAADKEEAAKKPTRTKRTKRSQAPRPPPQAPRSAYNFYVGERATVSPSHPLSKSVGLGIGAMWSGRRCIPRRGACRTRAPQHASPRHPTCVSTPRAPYSRLVVTWLTD